MKKINRTLIALLALTLSFAFSNPANDGLDVVYGVSNSDPSQIKLTLKPDFTFEYQDFSVAENKINVHGTYLVKNNKVQLLSNKGEGKFHSNWRITEKGTAAKSRKGLTFYTLRKIE